MTVYKGTSAVHSVHSARIVSWAESSISIESTAETACSTGHGVAAV
jgi:hypothetical protein